MDEKRVQYNLFGMMEYKVLIDNVYVPMYKFCSGDVGREALTKKLCNCSMTALKL